MNRKLYRSPDDRILAGVAGGMAETYDIDPSLVRIGWALLTVLTGGVFLVIYIVMALVVPLRPFSMPLWSASTAPGAPTDPQMAPNTGGPPATGYPSGYQGRPRGGNASGALIFGLILILAGGYFLARQFMPQLNLALLWPVVVIGLGALLVFGAFAGRGGRS